MLFCFNRKITYLEYSDSRRILWISSNVINMFNKSIQNSKGNESGGILLGNIYKDYDEIVKITFPNIADKRGPFFFVRARLPAQEKINISWKDSHGSLIYLGEWHTHHEDNPSPSLTDKEMIQGIIDDTQMEIAYSYLIIYGKKGDLWIGRQDKHRLIKLERIK